jgi:predicted transcriptional regulator YheO
MEKSEFQELVRHAVKKARAQRHSHKQILDGIGIIELINMVNKSTIEKVASELCVSQQTLYNYLNKRGARRKIQYVLEDEKGA